MVFGRLLLILAGALLGLEEVSSKPSLLVVIGSYSHAHYASLNEQFSSYSSICEAGWRVRIVLLTTAPWYPKTVEHVQRDSLFCYRIGGPVELQIRRYNRAVGWYLAQHSREPIEEYLNEFDVFMYTEDDMMMTLSLLEAWFTETKKLKQLVGNDAIIDKQVSYPYGLIYAFRLSLCHQLT
jgi:hypothetical protein